MGNATLTRPEPWMQTASGRVWPLIHPTPEHVHWPDVAEALAKLCRFNGHTTQFYSVAQHSVLVADMLPPEARPYGLVHDGHEAFIGDNTRPMKEALARLGAGSALEVLAEAADRAIFAAAGLAHPMPRPVAELVKRADLRLLATERRDVMADPRRSWATLPDPLTKPITPWPWPKAMDAFQDRLSRYLPTPVRRTV